VAIKRAFERFTEDIEASFREQRDERQRADRALIDRIATEGLRG